MYISHTNCIHTHTHTLTCTHISAALAMICPDWLSNSFQLSIHHPLLISVINQQVRWTYKRWRKCGSYEMCISLKIQLSPECWVHFNFSSSSQNMEKKKPKETLHWEQIQNRGRMVGMLTVFLCSTAVFSTVRTFCLHSPHGLFTSRNPSSNNMWCCSNSYLITKTLQGTLALPRKSHKSAVVYGQGKYSQDNWEVFNCQLIAPDISI